MGTGGSNWALVMQYGCGHLRKYFDKHGWPGEDKPKPRDGKRGQRRGRWK